jgi:predicted small secreted protein
MKSSYLRAAVLACTFALSACGGGGEDVVVGGNISGLTKDELVLQINGGSDLTLKAGTGSFMFPFKSDTAFEITVLRSPPNATCNVVSGGKGTTSNFNLTNVLVRCDIKTHKLSGTVIGLGNATDLVLINGADRRPVTPLPPGPDGVYPDVPVEFAPVAEDAPYGVTMLPRASGKSCSVANGVGKMGTTDITNVLVTCN